MAPRKPLREGKGQSGNAALDRAIAEAFRQRGVPVRAVMGLRAGRAGPRGLGLRTLLPVRPFVGMRLRCLNPALKAIRPDWPP